PDLDNLDEFGWVGIEIHHVARFFRGLSSRVHCHADVSLRERGCVIRTVASHGDKLATFLLTFDKCHLVFGSSLREEIVNTCFSGDRRGSERVVTRNHYRPYSHLPHLTKALDHASLDDVLELNYAQSYPALRNHQRGAAFSGDFFDDYSQLVRRGFTE